MRYLLLLFLILFAHVSYGGQFIHQNRSTDAGVNTSLYTTGDQMGDLFLLDGVGSKGATIHVDTVGVMDNAGQDAAFDILLFNDKPVLTSVDNGALAMSEAEFRSKFIGKYAIVATDYSDLDTGSVAFAAFAHRSIKLKNGSTGVWGILQAKDGPTYGAATDLMLNFIFETE